MELLQTALDLFINLDTHLGEIISNYGALTYVILFLIIFCETGLVVTPFLPGDSLLFAAGAFAAKGYFNVWFLMALLGVAGILGDTVNYRIGSIIGRRAFRMDWWFLRHEHLVAAEKFYETQGARTIIFARFVPIMRTFAPFVAGIANMHYPKFAMYNIVGGIIWVVLFTLGGYLFGNIPWVEENFSVVILGIIIVTILPGTVGWIRKKLRRGRN